jgi:non-ribosomal peptide synthetase component F
MHARVLPDVALWNEYGPTEATVWSTAYHVPRDFTGARVPIGRPVPGTRALVLQPDGEPAPVGAPGELLIAGAGVAAGYFGRPEETATRFVPEPFSSRADARAYRTGDRVRWRSDGTLEFLGRMDDQLKIRGYRIEPGEIESVLDTHPDIRASHVVARAWDDAAADKVEALGDALERLDAEEAHRLLDLIESDDDGGTD